MGKAVHKNLYHSQHNLLVEVYEKYHPGLIRTAKYYLRSYQQAEDVVADVFAKILEKSLDLRKIENIQNFLYTLVKRKCLDEIQKLSYKNRQDLENSINHKIFINFKDPETAYMNQELADKIKLSVEKLPDKCRTIFLMIKEDKLKYKEVAEILNISQKTVEMHMANALRALRKDLDAYSLPVKKDKKNSTFSFIMFIISII